MQVTHLLEQRLEDLVIDRHRLRTLLAAKRSPDQPQPIPPQLAWASDPVWQSIAFALGVVAEETASV